MVERPVGRARAIRDLAWRIALRAGYPLAKIWWRLRRPNHEAAMVAIHVGAAVLLLRSSYRARWNFPGGGMNAGETPEAAARRELMEEIAFVPSALTPNGVIQGNWHGRSERVHFFEVRLDCLPELTIDNREIVEARLVPLAQLDKFALTHATAAYFGKSSA